MTETQNSLKQRKNQSSESPTKSSNDKNSISEFYKKIEPYLSSLMDFYFTLQPKLEIAKSYINKGIKVIKPYYEKYYFPEVSEIILGLVLLFFGGHFAMTIACYTAIQISGLSLILSSWKSIVKNYNNAKKVLVSDSSVRDYLDEDGDGKISTNEMLKGANKFIKGDSNEKLKALQSFRNVIIAIDPSEVMKGVSGIWTSILAVLATLRSRFAKDVALGVSVGETLSRSCSKYIKPLIKKNVSKDLQKWANFCVDFLFKSFGITLALMLVRMTSALHSSVKGGRIITWYIFSFLANKQLIPKSMIIELQNMKSSINNLNNNELDKDGDGIDINDLQRIMLEGNKSFMIVQYCMAAYGFYWQLSSGFVINNILLRLLLLPFTICEVILSYLASY